jgi:eukaryotic-like serine/threonine-protein kinase
VSRRPTLAALFGRVRVALTPADYDAPLPREVPPRAAPAPPPALPARAPVFVELEQAVWAEGREQIRQRLQTRLDDVAAAQAETERPTCCGRRMHRHDRRRVSWSTPRSAHRRQGGVPARIMAPHRMPLAPGVRVGAYEVVSSLGAGGMGEVYRARDTSLDRDVALKILPELFASDPDRLMRFEREARTLASLNHPHIAHIYGIEQSAPSTGSGLVRALVMELVEGEDLAARIARGALPLDEALPVARQIAAALEAAHEAGVIHRDLKPANVRIRPDGTVKVLDFGLAKAVEPVGSRESHAAAHSPTFTSPALTQIGVLLGTAAYMAPEQAKGRPVDRRADIWAFGCVLYEMLTGRRAFGGEDVTDTIVAIASREPDWSALPAGTPQAVRELLRRCLDKDATERLRDIGEARVALARPPAPDLSTTESGRAGHTRRGRQGLLAAALLAAFAAGGFAAALWPRDRAAAPEPPVVRFTITPPDGTSWARFGAGAVVSPDGTMLLLHLEREGIPQLWLRPLDVLTARPLPGTERAEQPFWAPDSRAVGFVARNALKTVQLDTGRVAVICQPCAVSDPRWGSDDRIRFARGGDGLAEVPAAGGEPVRMWPSIDDAANVHVLPGGGVLYESGGGGDGASRISVNTIDGGRARLLFEEQDVRNSRVVYAPPGHMLYVRNHAVIARAFDPRRLELTGQPVQVAGGAGVFGPGRAILSASATGVLVYGNIRNLPPTSLTWVSRDGRPLSTLGPPGPYFWLALSGDGSRVAVERIDPDGQDAVWVMDAARGTMTRLTTEIGSWTGVWAPDGRRLVYSSAGPPTLYVRSIDADDPATPVGATLVRGFPTDWASDGSTILYSAGGNVMAIADAPGAAPVPYLTSSASESQARLSPDGRLAAYVSNESGVNEVYVAGFPRAGERVRVSLGGGRGPRWGGDGRELFYLADDVMMAADVALRDGRILVSSPRRLFATPRLSGRASGTFDVSPDGERFLLNVVTGESVSPVTVVLNWTAEIARGR